MHRKIFLDIQGAIFLIISTISSFIATIVLLPLGINNLLCLIFGIISSILFLLSFIPFIFNYFFLVFEDDKIFVTTLFGKRRRNINKRNELKRVEIRYFYKYSFVSDKFIILCFSDVKFPRNKSETHKFINIVYSVKRLNIIKEYFSLSDESIIYLDDHNSFDDFIKFNNNSFYG